MIRQPNKRFNTKKKEIIIVAPFDYHMDNAKKSYGLLK